MLQWRLTEAYKARLYQEHRSFRDLDLTLREMQNRWVRVERARKSAPSNTGDFAQRLAALKTRLDALRVRLTEARAKQNDLLERFAVAELEGQKDRLATYQIQARYALASIYDRAANADVKPAAAPAAAPAGAAPEAQPAPEAKREAAAAPVARLRTCTRRRVQCRLEKDAPTLKDLESRPIEVKPEAKVDASASRAMENYRRFLELQKTDPALRAEALRRLGDLNLESGELERMEKEVTTVDLQGAEAIKLYTTLLKAYPDYGRNDQVLYQLARAYETTGQPEKALATLDQIVSRYPQSQQLDEVHFRRGEILFSAKQYAAAQGAYQHAIERGSKSAFYQQSLYKHGWSLFKQGQNEDSLPSFARRARCHADRARVRRPREDHGFPHARQSRTR